MNISNPRDADDLLHIGDHGRSMLFAIPVILEDNVK